MDKRILKSLVGESKQVRRSGGWSARVRNAFLNHLAETCNVSWACDKVGMSRRGAYALRQADPQFAEQWRAAILTGYDTLEAALLDLAMRAVGIDSDDGDEPVGTGDADKASSAEPGATAAKPEGAGGTVGTKRDATKADKAGARPFDPEMAFKLLGMHRARITGKARPGGHSPKRATEAETDAAILKQLAALDRRNRAKRSS